MKTGSKRYGVHIWNINSIAEEFLRILPAYRDAFTKSCEKVRQDRDTLYRGLKDIPGMIAWPPDANFVFCRLPDHAPGARDIAGILYSEHLLLIKDCQGKSMPESDRYLRIASRTSKENRHLVKVLSNVLSHGRKEA